jgi:hypothetical protein
LIVVTLSLRGLAAVIHRIDDDGVVLAWSYSVDAGMFLLVLLSVGDRSNQKVQTTINYKGQRKKLGWQLW